jgi:hypothetical protein
VVEEIFGHILYVRVHREKSDAKYQNYYPLQSFERGDRSQPGFARVFVDCLWNLYRPVRAWLHT